MAASNRLDRVGAVRRAQRIRDGVSSISEVLDTLIEVQERQDWTSLGHKDFDEYCAVEFGPDQLKLSAERRGQVVGILIAGGMSKRGAAKALGVSEGTVRNDVKRSKGAQNYAPPAVEPQANDGPAPADIPEAMTQAITDVVSSVGAGVEFRPAFTESRCPETVDPKHCANGCGTPISWSDGTGGHLRCRKCDPSSLHHAIPDGDDWLPQCKYCTEISGSGDGASPVAGSGSENLAEEEAVEPPVDSPAAGWTENDRETAAESLAKLEAGTWKPAGSLRHLLDDCGGPDGTSSSLRPGTPRTLTDEVGHATCVHCLRAVIDSPAADEMPHIPTAGASPALAPQQPGQDSPTGRGRVSHEGRAAEAPDRSEADFPAGPDQQDQRSDASEVPAVATTVLPGIDHHEPGTGSGVAPEVAASVEPEELEDGDLAAVTSPSSGEPVVIYASIEDMQARTEEMEIPRAEWDAMTPAERQAVIDDFGDTCVSNAGGWGAGIQSGAPDSDLEHDEEPPSSSDPAVLLRLFAAFLYALDRTDIDVIAPLLLTEEMQQLHEAADRVATFVGLLETWRTP